MRPGSITVKLLAIIVGAFFFTGSAILLIADTQITRIIDHGQHKLAEKNLESILATLDSDNRRLLKTGLVEAYIDDFQDAAIKKLRHTLYRLPGQRRFIFIIDSGGRVLMHPRLSRGDRHFIDNALVPRLTSSATGDFNYEIDGEKRWLHYMRYSPWGWIVAYSIPLELKYADARAFHYLLAYTLVGTGLVALLLLSLIISRFTRPIIRLTKAATAMADGDLHSELIPGGNDEIGLLTRAFIDMRSSISGTITALESENRERKRAEDELAAEKEWLSVTLRSIGDGVITTDTNGRVRMLNRVAEHMTGWSNDEAVGRPLDEIFLIINEHTREVCENPVARVLNNGQIVELANHTLLIARDGTEYNIADSGAPILDAASNTVGVVLVFRDVSEKIRNQRELIRISKLESIGVLAGGIAHDFNNILAAILGNLNIALLDRDLNGETRELLAAAEKASLRARGLTRQLLTFARGGEPVKETASLKEVVRESADFVLHGDTVSCSCQLSDDLWLVDIDKGQISQVVQNIVLNASHAMPEGGTVSISGDNIAAAESPLARDSVRIRISDTGIGIPSTLLEKIFDPYFTTKQEGSGLGLAICQSIINRHGGQISVTSVPGSGTVFTIFLLASDHRREPRREIPVADTDAAGDGARVLVMDDDNMVATMVEAMLTRLGHRCDLAADGEEAIRRYREAMEADDPFDLVIMDLTIPGGMGGREAVGELLKIDPGARVVVSSGYSNDPIMADCGAYGFCAAIVKPYQSRDLAETIARARGERDRGTTR